MVSQPAHDWNHNLVVDERARQLARLGDVLQVASGVRQ